MKMNRLSKVAILRALLEPEIEWVGALQYSVK